MQSETKFKEKTVGGFKFESLKTILARPKEVRRWVVDNMLISGGLSILVGKPKTGKSTLVKSLVMAVAQGEEFLGIKCEPGKVLYVALEDHEGELQDDFEKLEAENTENVMIHFGRVPPNPIQLLTEEVRVIKPTLIIIDTLFKLVRIKDANSYAEINEEFSPLLNLARESGAHILCLHHAKKGSHKNDDSVLGSTAIMGMVDAAFNLKNESGGRSLTSTMRYGKDFDYPLEMDPTTKRIYLIGDKEEALIRRRLSKILETLQQETRSVSEETLIEIVRGRKSVFIAALRRGVSEGRIIRSGMGRKGEPYLYAIGSSVVVPPLRENSGNKNINSCSPNPLSRWERDQKKPNDLVDAEGEEL